MACQPKLAIFTSLLEFDVDWRWRENGLCGIAGSDIEFELLEFGGEWGGAGGRGSIKFEKRALTVSSFGGGTNHQHECRNEKNETYRHDENEFFPILLGRGAWGGWGYGRSLEYLLVLGKNGLIHMKKFKI